MKKVFAILMSVMLVFALCSCGGASVEGTEWTMSYMEVNGLKLTSEFLTEMGVECYISFEKDGATYVSPSGTEILDYSVEDNTVTMTNGQGKQLVAEIDGKTLTIDMGEEGIWEFVKE